jgi:hypothetical protein
VTENMREGTGHTSSESSVTCGRPVRRSLPATHPPQVEHRLDVLVGVQEPGVPQHPLQLGLRVQKGG